MLLGRVLMSSFKNKKVFVLNNRNSGNKPNVTGITIVAWLLCVFLFHLHSNVKCKLKIGVLIKKTWIMKWHFHQSLKLKVNCFDTLHRCHIGYTNEMKLTGKTTNLTEIILEKPILRPCLSDDKRGEMRRIKAKAMEIERRVAEKKRSPIIQCHQNTIGSITIEDGSIHSENNTDNDFDNDNLAASISEWDVSTILGDASDQENRTVACSEILETVDSNADDASDQCDNTFVDTPLPQSVIRSDSFIVDEPSKCFLKHLEDNGVTPNTSFTSLTDLSIKSEMSQKKFPTTQAAKRKTECKKITTPKLKKHPPKLFGIKKRHPTDNISNLPESIMRKSLSKTVNVAMKEKPMMKAIPSVYQTRRQLLSPSESTLAKTLHDQERSNQTMAIEDRNSEIIANIEEKYRTEIVLFLEKQKREQDAFLRKVMTEIKAKQDAFQRTLIMQLKAMIDGSVSKINRSNLLDIINNANAMSDLNGNVSVLDNSDDDGARIEVGRKIDHGHLFLLFLFNVQSFIFIDE